MKKCWNSTILKKYLNIEYIYYYYIILYYIILYVEYCRILVNTRDTEFKSVGLLLDFCRISVGFEKNM